MFRHKQPDEAKIRLFFCMVMIIAFWCDLSVHFLWQSRNSVYMEIKTHSIVLEAEFKYKTCLSHGTYSRAPCVAPWCVAACCTGLFRARTRWSRSTSPSRKRALLKTDIPLSCKHTRPWRGQLGPVRIQHQNRTTFPCSLEKKEKKKNAFIQL